MDNWHTRVADAAGRFMESDGQMDQILNEFQAMTGLEDVDTCIAVLEQANWDLNTAVNTLFEDSVNAVERERAEVQRDSAFASVSTASDFGQGLDLPRGWQNIRPAVPSQTEWVEAESDHSPMTLTFLISYHGVQHEEVVSRGTTVGDLTRAVKAKLGIANDHAALEGWPLEHAATLETPLADLNLGPVTYLALHSASKVTATPAEYKACNIPVCQGPAARDSDEELDEVVAATVPRAIYVPQLSDEHAPVATPVSITVNYLGKEYKLRYRDSHVVRDVKQEMYSLTSVPSRRQEWIGWPPAAEDQSLLGELDLQPSHQLIMIANAASAPPTVKSTSSQIINVDSGMDGSPDDTDLDDGHVISDDGDDEMFDQDVTPKKIKPMLPNDAPETCEALIQFVHQFEERYGEFHPAFFMGPLKDAAEEAAGPTAKDRRPLLIYLHHDSSILTNIFCTQILCSEHFVTYVSQNFLMWGWDMTFESNRQRFVNLLVSSFGDAAARSVSSFRDGQYPLLLIVMKSKGGYNVISILQASNSLDELMTSLINGYEVFEQAKAVEVTEEDARKAREDMRSEQDLAYLQSLASDRAKVEAERERLRQEQEHQRVEQLHAEKKEATRLSLLERLPDEPAHSEKDLTTLRFRVPNGDTLRRRFRASDKLGLVFMFAASQGFSSTEFRLLSHFPRREVREADSDRNLKELGLCPQETIFIEER